MKILNWLNNPTKPYGLALFRIFFGVIMLWDLNRIRRTGLIETMYEHEKIFHYDFINLPLPEQKNLEVLIALLSFAAVMIVIGLFYRYAMAFFALGFTYFFLMDPVFYNNHLYLICLLSFMMIFMPADAAFTVQKKRRRAEIPQWSYRLLQFQLVVVFFFGGIVKLNPYWFDFHPVQEALAAAASRTGNDWMDSSWMRYIFTYGGVLFDLLIGFALLIPRTRTIAIIAAIAFNLINSYVFDDIFIFPFFMICALILFVDQEKLQERLKKRSLLRQKEVETNAAPLGKIGLGVVGVYVIFQLVLPLRHYFMSGYTDWTGEGQRFAWRMKIQHRELTEPLQFAIMDLDRKEFHIVDPGKHLFQDEIQQMINSPQMIVQFAEYLRDVVAPKMDIRNCMIKSKVKVSFNGQPETYVFDPELDLLEVADSDKPMHEWVNALPEGE